MSVDWPRPPFSHSVLFGRFLLPTENSKILWEAMGIQTVDRVATATYRGANKSGAPDKCRQFMGKGIDQS